MRQCLLAGEEKKGIQVAFWKLRGNVNGWGKKQMVVSYID